MDINVNMVRCVLCEFYKPGQGKCTITVIGHIFIHPSTLQTACPM